MGYKLKNHYDDFNYPQSPLGAFCEGLFVGTLGFMTTLGGWLISLFFYCGMETSASLALAVATSVGVGMWLGISLARDCHRKKQKGEL